MTENLLIYNITAPLPYISMRNEMPRFNFLNGTIHNFAWFGWLALMFWVAILGWAFFRFLMPSQPNPNDKFLAISMLTCLLFNFILHIGYGTEPFLYSADWTYALILLVAISLKYLAGRTWFTVTLLLLVMAIFVNNLWFLYFITRQVGKFLVQVP